MENLRERKGNSEVNETNVQQGKLEAEEKVLSLQEVIKKLQMTKKFLHLNAVEVKASIHSNISRLLESMRSREVWLLNQVDLILEAKEVGLRHQEDQLNRTIGQLSNCLNIMDGGAALNSELNDLLCKIDSVGKHPVESPHISFRADIGSLRHAILEFGRVDSRRLPLEAFASPHLRCSSLPQPFEDYEDDEHHVFHKSVHEIHEKKHGKSIIFNIPKLSSDIPSWVSPIHSSADLASPSGMRSDFDADAKRKSDCKKQTTACSVTQWMQEMKMEDEDDVLLAPQFSSRFGSSKGIVGSASTSCLLLGSLSRNSSADGDSNKDDPHLRSDCFSFLSSRMQDWLVDGETRLLKSKITADKERLFTFEPCVFKPSADSSRKENVLENCMRKIAALPANCWLAPSAESAKLESETGSGILDDYARKIALLPWLISARGLTKESEKDLGREREMGIIENYARKIACLKWLVDEKEGPVDEDHGEFGVRENILLEEAEGILEAYARKLDSKTWVVKREGEEEKMPEEGKSFLDHMKYILQMSPNSWLFSDQDNKQASSLEFDNRAAEDNDDDDNDDDDDDDDDAVKDTSSFKREEEQEFTLEGKLGSGVNLDKYICSLNSFPIDHWLISAPPENVSEPNKFK